ncbi:uncharacterized protein LOC103569187 [Microplitis demolitor]|uniref:uncharacterized protein LOC103569187 n=1 Tax=Microplitis demolitor TaxID=69319 RepID=UPI0004CD96E6|nr:uncharacterized protein LOC103569187 [Microplitis demolitor]
MSKKAKSIVADVNNSQVISNTVARTASKKSVDKALELIRSRTFKKSIKRQADEEDETDHAINNCCIMSYTTSLMRINMSSAFTNNFSPTELRNAFRSQDWRSIQQLFVILLKCFYIETLAWKYAFLIFLSSPASDQSEFQEFIKMCIGINSANDGHLLEQLLSLQTKVLTDK